MKFLRIAIMTIALAGCASQQNRDLLAKYQFDCTQGILAACNAVPVQEQINKDEANHNAAKTAAVLILLPLLALAAAASARYSQPDYLLVPVRRY